MPGNCRKFSWGHFCISIPHKLQNRSNNVVCVFQPTWTGYTERRDPSCVCENCVCSVSIPLFRTLPSYERITIENNMYQQIHFRDFFSAHKLCFWNFVYIHKKTWIPLRQENIWQQVKCRINSVIVKLLKFWIYIWTQII